MTAFEPARPRYRLPFAGTDYELLGTFGLIEAVEYAVKAHIGVVAVQIVNGMPSYELTRVVAAVLTACGHPMTDKEAGERLWQVVGIEGDDNQTLRLHLYAFLSICLAPAGRPRAEGQRHGGDRGEAVGRFPWKQYRRVCLGVLRMPPSEFWGTDTWTVMDAYEGYAASKGVTVAGDEKLTTSDIEELNRMMAAEEERMAKAGSA